MDDLEQILNAYAEFETEVRSFSSVLWFRWCSSCRQVCCKSLYCRESFESPYLFLLSKNHNPEGLSGTHPDWLSESGCTLPVGRPPVCYEFLCNMILEVHQPAIR